MIIIFIYFKIINVCKNYKRTNEIEYDENYYFYKLGNFLKERNNIYINICENDYGPITSVFGLFNFKTCAKLHAIASPSLSASLQIIMSLHLLA